MSVSSKIELIKTVFAECSGPFVDFCKEVRSDQSDMSGKYSVRLQTVTNLFENSVVWEDQKKRGGHRKFRNTITGAVVEFSGHKDPVDPGAVRTIFDQVQTYVDTMRKNFFELTDRNWTFDAVNLKNVLRKLD